LMVRAIFDRKRSNAFFASATAGPETKSLISQQFARRFHTVKRHGVWPRKSEVFNKWGRQEDSGFRSYRRKKWYARSSPFLLLNPNILTPTHCVVSARSILTSAEKSSSANPASEAACNCSRIVSRRGKSSQPLVRDAKRMSLSRCLIENYGAKSFVLSFCSFSFTKPEQLTFL